MLNPQPKTWPQCAQCKEPFVLRRAIVFSPGRSGRTMSVGERWTWQRDCKHRQAAVSVARAKAGAK